MFWLHEDPNPLSSFLGYAINMVVIWYVFYPLKEREYLYVGLLLSPVLKSSELNPLISSEPLPGDTKFSNFWFYGQNPKVRPFIGKLLSRALLQFVFQFYQVCNFGKFIIFGAGKRVKK